jgi:hypothetical protein
MVKTLPLETYFSPSTTIVNNNSKVTILAEKAHLLAVKLAVIRVCQ